MTTIATNLKRVHESIAAACARVHRDPASVTLVAVSKTQPPPAILEAAAAGVQHFGENRVEEASTKISLVNQQATAPLIWHMVGHIQSRKAKSIPALFQQVHSLDSVKLAAKLSHLVGEQGGTLNVLLEMNVSGETSKSGFAAAGWSSDPAVRDRLCEDARQILALPGLNVRGLMTMAPIVADAEQTRPVFADLAALREMLVSALAVSLPDLSMGMTDDYPVAIEEGASIVRIGRAIFGERRS